MAGLDAAILYAGGPASVGEATDWQVSGNGFLGSFGTAGFVVARVCPCASGRSGRRRRGDGRRRLTSNCKHVLFRLLGSFGERASKAGRSAGVARAAE
jgi:hypothetical protein